MDLLNHENAKLKKDLSRVKPRTRESQREEHSKYEAERKIELSRKVQEYENMLPKLVELEHISEKIIGENNALKSKLKLQEALLNNVANITKCEETRTPTLDKIWTLTQSYLKAHVAAKKSSKD